MIHEDGYVVTAKIEGVGVDALRLVDLVDAFVAGGIFAIGQITDAFFVTFYQVVDRIVQEDGSTYLHVGYIGSGEGYLGLIDLCTCIDGNDEFFAEYLIGYLYAIVGELEDGLQWAFLKNLVVLVWTAWPDFVVGYDGYTTTTGCMTDFVAVDAQTVIDVIGFACFFLLVHGVAGEGWGVLEPEIDTAGWILGQKGWTVHAIACLVVLPGKVVFATVAEEEGGCLGFGHGGWGAYFPGIYVGGRSCNVGLEYNAVLYNLVRYFLTIGIDEDVLVEGLYLGLYQFFVAVDVQFVRYLDGGLLRSASSQRKAGC